MKPPMDIVLAERINAAIISFGTADIGFGEADVKALQHVSLTDMLRASAAVRRRNDRAHSHDGSKTIIMTCDDRLIAAIYTMLHYGRLTGSLFGDADDETVLHVPRHNHHHALIYVARLKSKVLEDEDA